MSATANADSTADGITWHAVAVDDVVKRLATDIEKGLAANEAGKRLQIRYKDRVLAKDYIADFICFDQIIVELKALDRLSGREEAQVLNYLKATGLHVGVLINFGSTSRLEWKRYIL